MLKKILGSLFLLSVLVFGVNAQEAIDVGKETNHKVLFHIYKDNPSLMRETLVNIKNIHKYFSEKGHTVKVEIVAYGKGIKMLTSESPVKSEIEIMSMEYDDVIFSACGNTIKAYAKGNIKLDIIPEARVVPAGVARIIELQEMGYAYVKP